MTNYIENVIKENPKVQEMLDQDFDEDLFFWKNQFKQYIDVKDIKTIFDIGAYKGWWSFQMARIFKNSNYFLFEPTFDKNIKYLEQNAEVIKSNGGNCKIINGLIGKEDKNIKFYESETKLGTGNSIYKELSTVKFNEVIKKMVRLDTLLTNHLSNIKPDLIKIDVQGAELDVLKGLSKFIHDVKYIQLEVSYFRNNKNGCFADEVIEYLILHGFYIVGVINSNKSKSKMMTIQQDYIFRNKKFMYRVNLNKNLK